MAAESGENSMLIHRFGREVTNYFSGNPLNRLSFLRGDNTFLSQALKHSSTQFLLFRNLNPLIVSQANGDQAEKLGWLKWTDVRTIIGEDYYASPAPSQPKPQVIFLGLDESVDGLTYPTPKNTYHGAPHFAVDVTITTDGEAPSKSQSDPQPNSPLTPLLQTYSYTFTPKRLMNLSAREASLFALSRQILDWNARNPYCAGCGTRTTSIHGGFKRHCPTPTCPSTKTISNLSFPRTDPTVIMAVLNSAGTQILLGQSKRFPPKWYSTLAGFVEPAESVEDAVRREVYEEAGVKVGRVVVHSTQPWPYPANLMIGAVAQAVPLGEEIDLGNDPELKDARWWDFGTVREALDRAGGLPDEDAKGDGQGEGVELRLPPKTAIAHQLIRAVVGDEREGSKI